ncbi:MAG: ATP-binding protein [Planctomycetaceae bacterium]
MHAPNTPVTAYDIMTCNVKAVPPGMTASDASRVMAQHGIRHLVVTSDDGMPLDVFSERDLLRHTVHKLGLNQNPGDTPIGDLTTHDPITIRSDASLGTVSSLLASHKIGCLPVVDDSNRVVGIISVVDVLRHFGRVASDDPPAGVAGKREQSAAEIHALVADFEMAKTYHEVNGAQLVALLDDLDTAKRRADHALSAKQEFLANMSHELRSPISAVTGFADLLADSDLTPEQAEFTERIKANSSHLLTLINDILDISKITAGKMTVEDVPLSPQQIVQDVLSSISPQAEPRGIELHSATSGPVPDAILSDPTRLRQVLFNLVSNAVKFTKRGSVRVILRAGEVDGAEPQLQFVVKDTGIGIAREQLPTLFEPFTQADASTTRRHGGTGLGLAISRHLAGLLGGAISVESELGSGSTFTLTIPIRPVAGNHSDKAADYAGPAMGDTLNGTDVGRGPLRGRRILVCDDNPDSRRLLRIQLEKAGAEVTVTAHGNAAIQAVKNSDATGKPFHLILMDMRMPLCDGLTATRHLRLIGCRIPIIAVTANAGAGDRDECINAGCDEHVSKPVDQESLIDLIVRRCERKSHDRRLHQEPEVAAGERHDAASGVIV